MRISIFTTVLLTILFLGLSTQMVYSQLPRVEFAVTYEVETPGQDSEIDTEIWVSIHHSDSSITHIEITDTPSGGGDPWLPDVEDPAIAMAPNGNIIVSWEQPKQPVTENSPDTIHYAVLDIDGNIIKAPTLLSSQGWDPCIAVNPENVVSIVWEYDKNGDDVVGFVTMDVAGDNVSSIREIPGFDSIDDPTVAASLQNGVDRRFVVAWEDGNTDEVVVTILDENGVTLVSNKMLTTASPRSNHEVNAAILPNGNAVISWEQHDEQGKDDLYYAIIDEKGDIIVSDVIDRPNDVGDQGVAATPGGHIVFVWKEELVVSTDLDIWYMIIDSSGNIIKQATRLTTSDDEQNDPDVTVDTSGNVIIIYEQEVANPDRIDFGILSSVGQIFGIDQLTDGTDDADLDGAEGRRQVAVRPAQSIPIGGITIPINTFAILTPYIALAGLILAVSTIYIIKRRKD